MVASNSSPLVYLAALGDFELLRHLFGKIAIPQTVFEEVVVGGIRFADRLAKQRQFIAAIRPRLDDLRRAGFWLRDEHYRIILESAGE